MPRRKRNVSEHEPSHPSESPTPTLLDTPPGSRLAAVIGADAVGIVMNLFVMLLCKRILFDLTQLLVEGLFFYILFFEFDVRKIDIDVSRYVGRAITHVHAVMQYVRLYRAV